MNNISVIFNSPWWLLLLLPGIFGSLFPFFLLKKKYRRSRNRIVPLVLHLVIVLMLTSLAAGLTIRTEAVAIKGDVLLVVDTSESTEHSRTKIDDFVKLTVTESDGKYNLGIITFAGEPEYAVKLTRNTRRIYQDYENSTKPSGGASNIERALLFAKEQLKSPRDGRIILISDGLETDGTASAAVRAAAGEGIRVDTVFFPSGNSAKEVKIASVDVPSRVNLGDSASVQVSLRSASAGNARLQLFANGVLYNERQIKLNGGSDSFAFTYVPNTPNLHELRVKVISDDDEILQNNDYWTFINIENENPRLLVLESVTGESAKLREMLSSDFIVDVLNISNAPSTISGLQNYDEVVLMNVAAADMPDGFDELLSAYVSVYGGGLFTAGGSRAYQSGDMQLSPLYEGMLPVSFTETVSYSVGLLIMIDTSSSMWRDNVNPSYLGDTRLELAKKAALDLINEYAGSNDYIGIMQYDGGPIVRAQMSHVNTQRPALRSAVEAISPGNGSVYTSALREADSIFSAFNSTDIKHVLFISDGDVQNDTQYLDAVSILSGHGVKLSVLGTGSGGSTNRGALTEMASRGGGLYLHADQGASQAEVSGYAREILEAARGVADTSGSFRPYIYRHTPAVQGVTQLPVTDGYYGAQAKNVADIVLRVAGADGDPFYVEWQYGLGRVGSLMCDLSGIWSANYFTDAQGMLFIKNIFSSSLLPSVPLRQRDIAVTFTSQNLMTFVEIETPLASGDTLNAIFTAPDGRVENIDLTRQSDSVYAASVSTGISGIYALEIVKKDRNGSLLSQTVAYTAFSYSQEYSAFSDVTANAAFMAGLAESGNGRVLYPTDELFGSKAESVITDFNPKIVFLSLSIALFLISIVFRKFKMKRAPKAVAHQAAAR